MLGITLRCKYQYVISRMCICDCSAEARGVLAGTESAVEKILLIVQDYDIASKE